MMRPSAAFFEIWTRGSETCFHSVTAPWVELVSRWWCWYSPFVFSVLFQEKWWWSLWCWWENPTSEGPSKFYSTQKTARENIFYHTVTSSFRLRVKVRVSVCLMKGLASIGHKEESWNDGGASKTCSQSIREIKYMCCACTCLFESTGGAGGHGGGCGEGDPAGPVERSVRQRSAPHRRVRFRQQLVRDRLAKGWWVTSSHGQRLLLRIIIFENFNILNLLPSLQQH